MITVPAMRIQQFGTILYQASLSVEDIRKLVRFEVLAIGEAQGKKRKASRAKSGVNWEELEKKISGSEKAFQRPILKRKIDDLVQYYRDRYEHMDLAPVPGAVILVADQRLDFLTHGSSDLMGFLQLPEQEGLFRTLDGQHRLLALAAFAQTEGTRPGVAEALASMAVPAVIFDNLSGSHAVELFVTINTKHTRLKKDVIVSLSGRKLYKDERMSAAHDIIRSLNERQDSPLKGDIRILGVGSGKVSQAPLAAEIEALIRAQEMAGPAAGTKFMEEARGLFLAYFKQIAQVFPQAWGGRKYSLKTGTALKAFIRVIPDVMAACRDRDLDPMSGRSLGQVIAPWAERIADIRFETNGEWRLKSAGGGSRTVELLARELRDALR